jgi:GGDEF domain-containing protein
VDGGRPVGPITASFGVASISGTPVTRPTLVHAADEALYAAKRAGRDRIVLNTDVAPPVGTAPS